MYSENAFISGGALISAGGRERGEGWDVCGWGGGTGTGLV